METNIYIQRQKTKQDNLYYLNNNKNLSNDRKQKIAKATRMVRCNPNHSTNSFHI
jgi:hypothetical protein